MSGKVSYADKNFDASAKISKDGLSFYDVKDEPFEIYGLYDAKNQEQFKRMPDEIGKNVNQGVAVLYTNTSGGRVRFSTDSDVVAIKVVLGEIGRYPHLAMTGSCGFDIYEDFPETQTSRYISTFIPPFDVTDGYESKATLPSRKKRYFTIHFPLYSDVKALLIGLREDATLGEGMKYRDVLPVVYYGNSVTQGGCASRAGNSYPNIIGRRMNVDFVNLGFSGAGKAEEIMTDYLASLDMGVFVCDYDHNAPNAQYLEATHKKLYEKIRASHPTLPIILMSKCDFSYGEENSIRRRDVIYETFRYAKSQGDMNVYFFDGESVYYGDFAHIAVIDRVHPSDLGFALIADKLGGVIERALQNLGI